ncbi:hypothetical protein QFZ52_000486 [Arthrobacter woluwensis]|uniref:O-antigen ligase family protein n=1 Tax=Arthrobacter woluwensis TaxID=156980 RepID=UPI002780E60C|nr:O-antigen ligase family protein [Arthrobacter woluwensis]MDQ0707834.1 hypothetical protein [Arthrobacter woluwensis]
MMVDYLIGAVAVVVLLLGIFLPRYKFVWGVYAIFASVSPAPVLLAASPSALFAGGTLLRTFSTAVRMLSQPVMLALFALTVTYALSAAWSPRPLAALGSSLTVLCIVGAVCLATASIGEGEPKDLFALTAIATAPIAAIQSISTIVFRLDLPLKDAYLHSSIPTLLLGAEGRDLFGTMGNNVLDPLKSGGVLFVNGNKASMVMAVWALIYLALCVRRRSFPAGAMAALCLAGAIATNSKTAMILAFSMIPVFLILPTVIRRQRHSASSVLGFVSLLAVGLGLALIASKLSEYLVGLDESASARDRLWAAAAGYFQESPWLGLGAGGWSERWAQDASGYGLPMLPPHNMVIAAWASAGAGAALLILAIIGMVGVTYIRRIRRAELKRDAWALSFELAAFTWMIAHSMYDNTDFYGTPQTIPFAALMIWRCYSFKKDASRSADFEKARKATVFQ